jgi:hypothetical protein
VGTLDAHHDTMSNVRIGRLGERRRILADHTPAGRNASVGASADS